MKVAVIGATGLVGRMMLSVLAERQFPCSVLIPAASARSAGRTVLFGSEYIRVQSIDEALEQKPDIALFSAGSAVSKDYAPRFAAAGTIVIDNSSAWRMNAGIPLVVPEVNASAIGRENRIIANPNCSTIQMVVAIHPVHRIWGIKRLVISTYQAVSGTGQDALRQLDDEEKGVRPAAMVYRHPIHRNCFPHGGEFLPDGYTSEEMKLVNETRKILGDENIAISATVVRIPVHSGHSECVNIETLLPFEMDEVRYELSAAQGIILMDDPEQAVYPTPLICAGRDEVFVGRVRRDFSLENGLNMWVVADNLRKGAATNAVQIAESLLKRGLL